MKERLTPEERAVLLRLARIAIVDHLRQDGSLDAYLASMQRTAGLERKRATFVTLKTRGQGVDSLRGCIGNLTPVEPLYRNVMENARRSAVRDPRFSPVTLEELPGLRLEISVLTPLEPIDGPGEIVPGRDGVELEKGSHGAVFLPQVATEQGWDTETLLENLARKALLPADGWKGAKLRTFQAEVFGEKEND
jgi:AmmeMemoRadiSam system protein A